MAPDDPRAWLVLGLTGSMLHAEARAGGRTERNVAAEVAAYQQAVSVSEDPAKTRATAARLLGWFGIGADALDEGAPPPGPAAD